MDGRRGNKATGMVIGGRAARACDVCGRERARWYCAADEAYLCERCDRSVHSANAVARRHERVRLGHNGAPVKIERNSSRLSLKKDDSSSRFLSSSGSHHGSRKRPRTSRRYSYNNPAASSPIKDGEVKPEPCSPIAEGQVPEFLIDEIVYPIEELGDVSHQVPTFAPGGNQESSASDPDSPLGGIAGYESSRPVPSASCCADNPKEEDELDFFIPENCIDINHFLDSGASFSELDVDIDIIMGKGKFPVNQISSMEDGLGLLDLCDNKELRETDYTLECSDSRILREDDGPEGDGEEICLNGESPSRWLCSKVKTENLTITEKFALEADTMLGSALDGVKSESGTQKLFLVLDYEDVLNAWSDRGSFWMDGRRPQTVPDDSCLDALGCMDAIGLVPELSFNSDSYGGQSGEQGGQVSGMVPEVSMKAGAREARVMRYREKRRTRLFSKKIRYEVRKLNAEKRPRMKGRFVKRAPGL